jgi:hypothetical protein
MRGTVPPLHQNAFMAWCSVKAQGQLYHTLDTVCRHRNFAVKRGELPEAYEPVTVERVAALRL